MSHIMVAFQYDRITTEDQCVVPNPFNRQPLIHQTEILFRVRTARKSEDINTIVYGYDDNIFVLCEVCATIERSICISSGKA